MDQFSQAVKEGVTGGAPVSADPIMSNFYAGQFASAAVKPAGKALGVVAAQTADDEEKRRKQAAAARMQEIEDQLDPSKYKRLRKDDGGYAFYDPTGKEIDIDTYAKRTGMRRVDAISESENPIDQQFADDYNMMNELNQAVWRNDSAKIADFKALYPELFSNGNPTPETINKLLLQKYPHMFGMGNYQTSLSNLGKPLFRATDTQASGDSGGGWSW